MGHKQLTQEQRYHMYGLWKAGLNQVEMAKELGVHKSTISREFKRNTRWNGYFPGQAQWFRDDRRRTTRTYYKFNDTIKEFVKEKIQKKWSPEQMSGYAKRHGLFSISHERIYQFVLQDKKEGGKLYRHLRHQSRKYKKRYGCLNNRGPIKNRVFIDDRPKVVNAKERVGDWEIDTIIGKNRQKAIVTIVERVTKICVCKKVENRKSKVVTKAIIDSLKPLSKFVLTITGDNGSEFAEHAKIKDELKADFYFAHPYSSWERGLNENTNGLLRQYFPKGCDFSEIGEPQLDLVVGELNNRPRKSLSYLTPQEAFELAFGGNKCNITGSPVAFKI
jgi:IS30 family transposase